MRDITPQEVESAVLSRQVSFGEKPSPKSPIFRKANILLADDEPIVRKFLVAALPTERYRIFQACDGLDGILIWHERKPIDLIIADVNMPGLDGSQLVEAIWAEEYTPVLYISGLPPGGLAARHIQDSRARFLAKPFHPDAL